MAQYTVIRELPCIVGRAGKPDAVPPPPGQKVDTADPAVARMLAIYGSRYLT